MSEALHEPAGEKEIPGRKRSAAAQDGSGKGGGERICGTGRRQLANGKRAAVRGIAHPRHSNPSSTRIYIRHERGRKIRPLGLGRLSGTVTSEVKPPTRSQETKAQPPCQDLLVS